MSVCFFPAAHFGGAVRAVFPPVCFGEKIPAALGTAFPVCPVQKGGFQFPVQRQHGGNEPAAQEGIADTLHTHARLAVIQHNTIPVVIVAALMHKPTRRPVL